MSATWLHRNRAQVRLAVRITTASFLAYLVGQVLGLQQSHWAVLTSIIVMQASVGASLKAMLDRFTGSLGGAAAGVAISLGLHHLGLDSPGLAIAIGLPPLALLAALKPSYRVAPITFIILILTPDLQRMGPVDSAIHRLLEIAVGSVIALGVSLFVMPARAHDVLALAVSRALAAMADLMAVLPGGLSGDPHPADFEAAHVRIRTEIAKAELAAEEALRERASLLTGASDPLPICRTLRRLRHDLANLGRTMTAPLPDPVGAAMTPPILAVTDQISLFFRASASAFANRAAPPDLDDLEAAFVVQAETVTEVRQQHVTRDLPDDDIARIFGLTFALEQLHRDLRDLQDRGNELAGPAQ